MLDDPELIKKVRKKFANIDACPVYGERVFFENAGGALTLKSVVETSTKFSGIPDNQGRDNPASKELDLVVSKGRKDAALFLNASSGQIFIGESGTELLFRMISEACLNSLNSGRIVGSSLEHPASRSAAKRWAQISGLEYVEVPHNNITGSVTAIDYEDHIDAQTVVVTIIHTSPITGISVDITAISKVIRKKAPNCFIIVDGIQHAAHGNIDIDLYNIDGYVISPYKVFSRHGFGIAWISDRFSTIPHNRLQGSPENNWELGTRDPGSFASISNVVEYFEWLGEEIGGDSDRRTKILTAAGGIHEQEKILTQALLYGTGNLKGLTELPNMHIIGGQNNPDREGLVSFYVEGLSSVDIVKHLEKQKIRVHIRKDDHYSGNILKPLKRTDCVRISMCHYNTVQEVAKCLAAIAEISL